MKQIVLVALMIAAGCTRQPSERPTAEPTVPQDCDAAVDQGIKRLTAGLRTYAPDPQTLESGIHTFEQIQGTLIRRCTVDRWPAEVTHCFATMTSGTDLQACQRRLSSDSSSRLASEIAEATQRREVQVAECKPPVRLSRTERARNAKRDAMDMMVDYKVALCRCKDHDMDCGKATTDDFQRAMANWAATHAGEPGEFDAKPDPRMEKLTEELAECSKRVMTPDLGPTGNRSP
jgi:hypothetical protein